MKLLPNHIRPDSKTAKGMGSSPSKASSAEADIPLHGMIKKGSGVTENSGGRFASRRKRWFEMRKEEQKEQEVLIRE